ncbi:DUF1376 domain-containing protein [Acinetobacter sp. ULE_I092]|uniref:DUF1376 domain-containing protein n=1 Tax=Acinetobacter sp. ULE_I092 TaxID=3373075 RepID=UPI003AF6660C
MSETENNSQLPKPLVLENVDLRDFEYMPLDVVRFRDSDFTALVEAEAFRAGFLLMCASWHQVPAGSIPNDDRVLSNLAGFGRVVKEWEKFKEEALHGWILCDDNRYYHPVVSEKALESWKSKREYSYKKFADRIRKANKQLPEHQQITIPSFDVWVSAGMPSDWSNDSTRKISESQIASNNFPKEHVSVSEVVPKEAQNNSAGIPSENALKGTEHNIREHNINNKNICPPSGEPEPAKNQNFKNEIQEIFEFWKATFGKSNQTVLDDKRKSKILSRLKQGYSVEQIKQGIIGCSKSDYHVERKHTDIELICREASKLDRFIEMVPPVEQQTQQPHYDDLQNKPPEQQVQFTMVETDYLAMGMEMLNGK